MLMRIRRKAGNYFEYRKMKSLSKHYDKHTNDIGSEKCIISSLQWLIDAQNHSSTNDNGIARHYHIAKGWGPSYPETSGYIIPTLLKCSEVFCEPDLSRRARSVLDWLVEIQLSDGAFQGGTVCVQQIVPVAFNTGQIILGLASGVDSFGSQYLLPLIRASEWLCRVQDADGSWTSTKSPFGGPGLKSYDTHIAWGLFRAAEVTGRKEFFNTAERNIEWALSFQHKNGWPSNCCLSNPDKPLTHTIGYYLRGLIEAYRYTKKQEYLDAALLLSSGLSDVVTNSGFLPGRIGSNWENASNWSCLTGSAQIAACWFLLSEITHNSTLQNLAIRVNGYIRRSMISDGPLGVKGGVKGSDPIAGSYNPFMYLNWAAKFSIDSFLMELQL